MSYRTVAVPNWGVMLFMKKRLARKLLQLLNEKSVEDPDFAHLYELLKIKLES